MALFVVIMVVVLIARGRGTRPESVESIEAKADYRIKEVQLREEGKGGVRWQLDAAQAETYEQAGKTLLKKVKVTIDEPNRSWTVTGDEGEMADASKDVELRGNVVLVSSDGLRLETTRIFWVGADQRAWTNDPVTIYRSGAVVKGQGLEARVGEQATTVKGRVRAVFSRGSAPGTGSGS